MKSWIVYEHWSPSGKVYVGITDNVKSRWAAKGYYYHLSDTIFSRALNKYGWDYFTHEIILEGRTKAEALYAERYLIRWYKMRGICYNMTDGGEGYWGEHTPEHVAHRVESRIANSNIDYLVIDKNFNYVVCKTQREAGELLNGKQSNIAHVLTQPVGYTFRDHYIWKHEKGTPVCIDEIREQIEIALALRHEHFSALTKARSPELVASSRAAMAQMTAEEKKLKFGHSESRLGKHHSEETRQKLSEIAKGRDMSVAHAASMRVLSIPVVQLLNGQIMNHFASIKEASRVTKINAQQITECVKQERNTAGGYCWKQIEERRKIA